MNKHLDEKIAALREAVAEVDALAERLQRRIDTLNLAGEALAFEQGRLDGARVARIRLQGLIDAAEGDDEDSDAHSPECWDDCDGSDNDRHISQREYEAGIR